MMKHSCASRCMRWVLFHCKERVQTDGRQYQARTKKIPVRCLAQCKWVNLSNLWGLFVLFPRIGSHWLFFISIPSNRLSLLVLIDSTRPAKSVGWASTNFQDAHLARCLEWFDWQWGRAAPDWCPSAIGRRFLSPRLTCSRILSLFYPNRDCLPFFFGKHIIASIASFMKRLLECSGGSLLRDSKRNKEPKSVDVRCRGA